MRAAIVAVALALSAHVAAGQAPVFRMVTESVWVDVGVQQRGRPVTDLSAANFEVRDNGVLQTLSDVSREVTPVDVTLVVDVSGSIDGPLLASLQRALAAIGRQLRPADRAKLVTFNHRVHETGGFTEGRLPAQATSLAPPFGQTSLFDAVALSVISRPESGRRQMAIVFTDGRDTLSFMDESAVIDAASRSTMAIFVVAVSPGSSRLPQPAAHEALFRTITDTTGGVLQVMQRDEDLAPSFAIAFDDFRTSYVLRYTVTGRGRPGWHELDVRVTRPGRFDIRARKGYFRVA